LIDADENSSKYLLSVHTEEEDGRNLDLYYQIGEDENDEDDHIVDGDEKLVT
jgi:hypothetical protein